jgi:hypothetical protein
MRHRSLRCVRMILQENKRFHPGSRWLLRHPLIYKTTASFRGLRHVYRTDANFAETITPEQLMDLVFIPKLWLGVTIAIGINKCASHLNARCRTCRSCSDMSAQFRPIPTKSYTRHDFRISRRDLSTLLPKLFNISFINHF